MSLVLLLDPINMMLGRKPSMFRDWQNGWYGRTLAALAGGVDLAGFFGGVLRNYWADEMGLSFAVFGGDGAIQVF